MKHKWYQTKVVKGEKRGRKLGFPTLNLDNPLLLSDYKEGVYACQIRINKKLYEGMLFFGPRLILGETTNVLEIFVFDFNQFIYGKSVYFQVLDYIREAKSFSGIDTFKKQLLLDCEKAKKILKYKVKPM